MSKTTSRAKALAHEALVLRLTALLDQVAALAMRHPDAAVPPETRAIAEALLYEAAPFVHGRFTSPFGGEVGPKDRVRGPSLPSRGKGLPAAAEISAALASQLGQARAALEMWEAEHSHWNGECFVWRLTRGEDPVPIQRLRARAKLATNDPVQQRHSTRLREMLMRSITARFGEGYNRGYADAQQGVPSRPDEFYPRRVDTD